MGYRLNSLDEPVFIAVSKPLLTEFGIHRRLESCGHEKLGKKLVLCVTFCSRSLGPLVIDVEGGRTFIH